MSVRKREAIMRDVGMTMLQERKILSLGEYNRLPSVPVRSALVLKQFGSWARMVQIMESSIPEIFKEIRSYNLEPDFDERPMDPLEALANKTVSKTL